MFLFWPAVLKFFLSPAEKAADGHWEIIHPYALCKWLQDHQHHFHLWCACHVVALTTAVPMHLVYPGKGSL